MILVDSVNFTEHHDKVSKAPDHRGRSTPLPFSTNVHGWTDAGLLVLFVTHAAGLNVLELGHLRLLSIAQMAAMHEGTAHSTACQQIFS